MIRGRTHLRISDLAGKIIRYPTIQAIWALEVFEPGHYRKSDTHPSFNGVAQIAWKVLASSKHPRGVAAASLIIEPRVYNHAQKALGCRLPKVRLLRRPPQVKGSTQGPAIRKPEYRFGKAMFQI